ncbi:uncharacterized protein EAE97_000740 [Botrytis byssoidea]|uniref:Uncharacterized protein n=1 Tax=Botrytis byssoidea TaxID=139641 RepID=A0A9P5LZR2_9HELO|nr:uncharacterized protein EAE97_000740 [Botrytis byssoidea]KAF7955481.1 hypothetical protein EAE97_000740 [Botrytis byssoidea]
MHPAIFEDPKQKQKVDKTHYRNQHLTLASPDLPHLPILQPARNSPPKSTSPSMCPPVNFALLGSRVSLYTYPHLNAHPSSPPKKYSVCIIFVPAKKTPLFQTLDPGLAIIWESCVSKRGWASQGTDARHAGTAEGY